MLASAGKTSTISDNAASVDHKQFAGGASIALLTSVSEPLFNANTDDRYECLDAFPLTWIPAGVEEQSFDCAILLGIWKTGGMLQASVPIPEGTLVELTLTSHAISATITGCEQDSSEYLLSFSIIESQCDRWFPQSYCPPNLHSGQEEVMQLAKSA
jgi:hypothetical protein